MSQTTSEVLHERGEDLYRLGLDGEMEDVELGGEVAYELAVERFAGIYSTHQDRCFSMLLLLLRRMREGGVVVDAEPFVARYGGGSV